MTIKALSIDLLRIDADTQARVKISEETVDDYAEVIKDEKAWPMGAVDVFHDGTDYFVADGFHRTLAATRVKRASIPCKIHKGTAADARIFGMTANDEHGLRMSRADKRKCVEWLLDNGGKMSQAKIAETAGVSLRTVKYIVAERKPEKVQIAPSTAQAAKDGETANDSSPPDEPRISHASGDGVSPRDPDVDLGNPERHDLNDGPGANEPAPEPPKREEWRIARSRAKKTAEALMRALDDLNDLKTVPALKSHLDDCGAIILELDAMK